jgi:hypothetical protein
MTTFAANKPSSILFNKNWSSYFYGYLNAAISHDIRLSIHCELLHSCCNLNLAVCGKIAFPHFTYLIFHHEMPSSMKNQSVAKHSTNTLTPTGATSVQVIHQIIIPEKPTGLIGEKVVYNEKFLKGVKNPDEYLSLIPECGYFIITKAVLREDGNVMVALYPWTSGRTHFVDSTHICVGNMKKYKP